MGVFQRPGFAVLATIGLSAAAAGFGTSSPGNAATPGTAPAAAPFSCLPDRTRAHGVLPSPPSEDTWTLTPLSGPVALRHAFTIDVHQQVQRAPGTSAPVALYCYTDEKSSTPYVEAPTIRVKQGGTFSLTLVDKIPGPIGTPPASAPDGCALLPYEDPLPPPSALGYFNHLRIRSPKPVTGTSAMAGMTGMLKNDTNFHTHGWHVDPNVDNVFKSLAHTKGGRCTFPFAVPMTQPPGTYWYHAHLHGIAKEQVGGGLAGALVVVPAGTPPPQDVPDHLPDVTVIIKNDNVVQGPHGSERARIAPGVLGHYARVLGARRSAPNVAVAPVPAATATPLGPADPWNPSPWPAGVPVGNGTPAPGTTAAPCAAPPASSSAVDDPLQANGQPLPNSTAASPSIPSVTQRIGQPTRYRIIDATSDTYLNLQLLDANNKVQPMTVVARDGVPVNWNLDTASFSPDITKVPWYVTRTNVFLAPSNRVDVVVDLRTPGMTLPVRFVSLEGNASNAGTQGHPYCTGPSGLYMPARGILTIRPVRTLTATAAGATALPRNALGKTAADLFAENAPLTGRRVLTFTQYDFFTAFYVTETGRQGSSTISSPAPAPLFTEKPFWLVPYAGVPPTTPPIANHFLPTIRVPQNSIEEWTLINASPEIHAFHIHQLTFTALQSLFEPTVQRVYLDSIPLPAGTVAPGPQPTADAQGNWFPLMVPTKTVIKMDFRHVDRGTFVYHCHMLSHEDNGMMGIVEVY